MLHYKTYKTERGQVYGYIDMCFAHTIYIYTLCVCDELYLYPLSFLVQQCVCIKYVIFYFVRVHRISPPHSLSLCIWLDTHKNIYVCSVCLYVCVQHMGEKSYEMRLNLISLLVRALILTLQHFLICAEHLCLLFSSCP